MIDWAAERKSVDLTKPVQVWFWDHAKDVISFEESAVHFFCIDPEQLMEIFINLAKTEHS